MASAQDAQKRLIRKAFLDGKATLIENTEMQVAKNIVGHGWAHVIEDRRNPSTGTTDANYR
jgi:hypothetical protein